METSQAAVKVPDPALEKQTAKPGKDRVAQVTVEKGHGAFSDAPFKTPF